MKSHWNWSAKFDAILVGGVSIFIFIVAIAMYKEPAMFLVSLILPTIILFSYRNKHLWVKIDGDEIVLKKIFKTSILHRSEIDAYAELDRYYGKAGKYKELTLYVNAEKYTILGGFFKNYDEIRDNLITPKLENRTQEEIEKDAKNARWASIVFFGLAVGFSYLAYKETQMAVIEEKDVKTIKGKLSFYPNYNSRKEGKYGRAYYLVLQVKDCNRFFHIEEPMLGEMPKLPPPPMATENEMPTPKPSIESTPFSYFNIKDTVEVLYVDRHTAKDLKAKVYGLRHNEKTYFLKNWAEIKTMIDDENDSKLFAVLALLSFLFGISVALGYTSKWFTGVTV